METYQPFCFDIQCILFFRIIVPSKFANIELVGHRRNLSQKPSAQADESEDESKCALTDESEDEAMPNGVNEDPFDPIEYGDAWALSLFQKSYWRMNAVLTELGLGTVSRPQEEKVPNYAYAFHLLTDNLNKLSGTLKVASKEIADKKGVRVADM